MSDRVTFSCVCVNATMTALYNLKEDECVWRVSKSRFEWKAFMRDVKVRLLSKSIHKGKFLGFKIRGTIVQQFDLADVSLASAGDIELMIENCNIDDNELTDVIQRKLGAFSQMAQTAALSDLDALRMRQAKELAYTSDKIEGTTIEADEAKSFLERFRDEIPEELCDNDHVEMRNHMLTIVDIVFPMRDQPLTSINLEFILSLHRALGVTHIREEEKGAFRTKEVTIAGGPNPNFTRAIDVPHAVDEMLQKLYNMSDNTDTLWVAAWLHFTFIQIHPFIDGNGRVGRLLMNTLLLQRGYPLVCIHPNVRDTYFESLRVARRIKVGAMPLPKGTQTPYDFLKRLLSEFTVRSLDIAIHTLQG